MTDKKPKKPFNLSACQSRKEERTIRDKDNAHPRVKPPTWAKAPSPTQGPGGTKGIVRNSATPKNAKQEPKRFKLGEKGELKGKFKPIVRNDPAKGPNIDR